MKSSSLSISIVTVAASIMLTVYTVSIIPEVNASPIEEIVVSSPRVSGSGSRWVLAERVRSYDTRIQQMDIDDLDAREDACDLTEKKIRVECEITVLANVAGRTANCSAHHSTPQTTSEYEVTTPVISGSITVQTSSGAERYNACIDQVNAIKETQLRQCELESWNARRDGKC